MDPAVRSARPARAVAPGPHFSDGRRLGPLALAVAGGLAIFVGGTPYFELTSANDNPLYNGALALAFGVAAVRSRQIGARSYAEISGALFVAAVAMLVMVIGPFNWLVGSDDGSAQHALQDKLAQFLAVVPIVLLLTWAGGRPRHRLYAGAGRPKRWLAFGGATLVLGATTITLAALASGSGIDEILSLAPWVLAFAVLNASMEELWFRGIFLRPYVEHMGTTTAVLVTAVVFGAAHLQATYISAPQQLLFAALVVGLGAILGWAVHWANSLWGAVLFHIGLDLVVLLEFVEGG